MFVVVLVAAIKAVASADFSIVIFFSSIQWINFGLPPKTAETTKTRNVILVVFF